MWLKDEKEAKKLNSRKKIVLSLKSTMQFD